MSDFGLNPETCPHEFEVGDDRCLGCGIRWADLFTIVVEDLAPPDEILGVSVESRHSRFAPV